MPRPAIHISLPMVSYRTDCVRPVGNEIAPRLFRGLFGCSDLYAGRVPIDRRSRASEHLANIRSADPDRLQLSSLGGVGVVALPGAATPSAVRRRCCQPCTGPLDHCVSLELSECGHDRKHGLSHRAVRVESLCDATEADSTLR